jgi:hypothetical protein
MQARPGEFRVDGCRIDLTSMGMRCRISSLQARILALTTHHMKKATQSVAFGNAGGSGEIRTRDQWIKSPLLYRLSYRPLKDLT